MVHIRDWEGEERVVDNSCMSWEGWKLVSDPDPRKIEKEGLVNWAGWKCSLVSRPRAPPGEKRSGERSRISWAYYPKRVMTNEIARSVIIT